MKVLDCRKYIDPYTFEPKLRVEVEVKLELLKDLNLEEGSDEYYKYIGKSLETAIRLYEPEILVWENVFTEEELKNALRDLGVKVYDNLENPISFPKYEGVYISFPKYEGVYEYSAFTAKTARIYDVPVKEVAKQLAKAGNCFALYDLLIPKYNKTTKEYEYNSKLTEQFSSPLVYNSTTNKTELLSKIRFASW